MSFDQLLPPEPVREGIAAALHDSLTAVMSPGITHIAPINTIGCFLLRHIAGIEYVPVAGSITVNAGAQRFGMVALPERIAEHEYYLWSEARFEDGSVALADFGARYWKAWARDKGVLWTGPAPPDAVWDWRAEVPETLAYYEEEPSVTNDVRGAIEQAVSTPEGDSPIRVWEETINATIDRLLDIEVCRAYLEARGIVEAS